MKAALLAFVLTVASGMQAADFAAGGPTRETKLPPDKSLGAVKVIFDLNPTTISFDLPWHYGSVAENGLKFAHFAAESYDPRNWGATVLMLRLRPARTKRAAIVPRMTTGPERISFALDVIDDE